MAPSAEVPYGTLDLINKTTQAASSFHAHVDFLAGKWSADSGPIYKIEFTGTKPQGALPSDPNRTAFIALIRYPDGELNYILAPQRLAIGDQVVSGERVDIKPGNTLPMREV